MMQSDILSELENSDTDSRSATNYFQNLKLSVDSQPNPGPESI